MRVVATSDLHLRDGDQADDQQRMLDQLADLCETEHAAALLIAGDIAHTRHPSEETRAVFRRFCERVDETCPVVAVTGDHDVAATSDVPWAVLMDGLVAHVAHRPGTYTIYEPRGFGKVAGVVAALPYPHKANLSTYLYDRPELGPADTVGAEAVIATARRLRDEIPADVPAVLLGHLKHWIDGARIPSGLPVGAVGPTLPVHELLDLGFAAVVMGDLHEPQVIDPGARPVLYAGSPMTRDFGEAHFQHGCFVLEVEPDRAEARFVPLVGRPWITLEEDLAESNGIAIGASVGFDRDLLDGAVVRLRYQATAEQHRRVDQTALRQALMDAGAHRVTIQPDIVRVERARVEGMTEALDELEALDRWMSANDVELPWPDRLRAYTRDGLQAVSA